MSDEDNNEIFSHLSKMQKALNVPKTRYNKFQDYYYRNAEDIVEAIKGIMPADVYLVITDDIVLVGDRYYVRATASLWCNGHQVSASAYARESLEKKGQDAPQITGTSSSYARKYALNGLFSIDDGDDVDSKDNREEKGSSKSSSIPLVNEKDIEKLKSLIKQTNTDINDFMVAYEVKLFNALNKNQYLDALKKLERKVENMKEGK